MNDHFTNVKVDREERPDVDAVYMQATTAMTGQGGWPMTVLLTPTASRSSPAPTSPTGPGTGSRPSGRCSRRCREAWRTRRDEVTKVAADVSGHLQQDTGHLAGEEPIDADVLAAAVTSLAGDFDGTAAGFGGAPKFPPSMVLEFLLRHAARTGSPNASGDGSTARCARWPAAASTTSSAAGSRATRWTGPGWCRTSRRCSTTTRSCCGVYVRWWRQTGDPLGERVARETADFLLTELRTDQGGFASALDADSEGVEGKFYAWTPAQLREVLGDEDGGWAADLLSVTPDGTFEHGSSTLQLLADPDDPERWAAVRERLLAARASRVRPARDDKVVAAWNGLAVASLAEAGVLLAEPRYVDAAVDAARLLVDRHLDGGRLRRVSRDGDVGRHAGVLEDYGCVADGLLALLSATGDPAWLRTAGDLLDTALERFAAPDGGFFDTAEDAEPLVARPRDPSDNASPSGQSALVHALLSYAAADRVGPAPRRGGGGAAHRPHPRRAGAAVRGLVARRRGGRR